MRKHWSVMQLANQVNGIHLDAEIQASCRACLAGLRLLQKQLRLLWWNGFSGGAGAVLENVWQNSFPC